MALAYDSTQAYNNAFSYNADDEEIWHLGDIPILKGFLGVDQVYPRQKEEPPRPPSEGLYQALAGWQNGVAPSTDTKPAQNQIRFNSDDLSEMNEITLHKVKSGYVDFDASMVHIGEWFIISQDTGRVYGEFTEIVNEDADTITARFKNLETMGSSFVADNYVNLGYFVYFADSRTDQVWIED